MVGVKRVVYQPGARDHAHAHLHDSPTTVHVEAGIGITYVGRQLEERIVTRPGETLLIPAGVPHCALNGSSGKLVALVVRHSRHLPDTWEVPDLQATVERLFEEEQSQGRLSE